MLFTEEIAATNHHVKLEIFGSDVDETAVLSPAMGSIRTRFGLNSHKGSYPAFFVREEKGYRIIRELRDTIVFTVHDVLTSAPFVRIDLLSCRNLLIYLRPDVQENLLGLFSFALRPGGTLLLGTSETVGNITRYSSRIRKGKESIYARLASGSVQSSFRLNYALTMHHTNP